MLILSSCAASVKQGRTAMAKSARSSINAATSSLKVVDVRHFGLHPALGGSRHARSCSNIVQIRGCETSKITQRRSKSQSGMATLIFYAFFARQRRVPMARGQTRAWLACTSASPRACGVFRGGRAVTQEQLQSISKGETRTRRKTTTVLLLHFGHGTWFHAQVASVWCGNITSAMSESATSFLACLVSIYCHYNSSRTSSNFLGE